MPVGLVVYVHGMTNLIRIPKGFYEDHGDRALPTPVAVKETGRHVWIDRSDPDMAELVNDAEFYADPWGPETPGLRLAARALLKALAPTMTPAQARVILAKGKA